VVVSQLWKQRTEGVGRGIRYRDLEIFGKFLEYSIGSREASLEILLDFATQVAAGIVVVVLAALFGMSSRRMQGTDNDSSGHAAVGTSAGIGGTGSAFSDDAPRRSVRLFASNAIAALWFCILVGSQWYFGFVAEPQMYTHAGVMFGAKVAFAAFGLSGLAAGIQLVRLSSQSSSPVMVWVLFLTCLALFLFLGVLLFDGWNGYRGEDVRQVALLALAFVPIGLAYFVTQLSFARR
jgi:hypothetical protein